MELDTVGGQRVECLVGELVAGGQVQLLYVGAVLGETDQGRVSDILGSRYVTVIICYVNRC